jgi:hypothetical protein
MPIFSLIGTAPAAIKYIVRELALPGNFAQSVHCTRAESLLKIERNWWDRSLNPPEQKTGLTVYV